MEKTIIYNRKKHTIKEVFDLFYEDYKFIFPRCTSELLILPDYNYSSQHQRYPGIYCPRNENHVGIRLFFRSAREEIWKKFHALQAERRNAEKWN